MYIKKTLIFSTIFLFLFFLSACSRVKSPDVLMDQLASDNQYHYTNESLAFSVNFPEQFIYYQSQKIKEKDYIHVEFFVPTSDREYPQEVQSYGKFLTVSVYDDDNYDGIDKLDKTDIVFLGKKNARIFLAKFWDKVPSDWHDKWNEEVKQEIIDSFTIN